MELTKINGKYELWLPEHRATRPEWKLDNGGWEVERIEEMLKVLKPSDILFECGVEEGDLTALLVKESGCKVVMFEPNNRVWPCIKMIWEANELPAPLDFYPGFVSDKTIEHTKQILSLSEVDASAMIPDHGFKQLYENYPDVPQITIDDYCKQTGIYPTVLNIDVEGSEGMLLRGAEKTLRKKRPIIFFSLHPEFLYIHYNEWVTPLLRFIDECGYKRICLEYDWHELHILAMPVEKVKDYDISVKL